MGQRWPACTAEEGLGRPSPEAFTFHEPRQKGDYAFASARPYLFCDGERMGRSSDYIERAARVDEMARQATNSKLKTELEDIAAQWRELARQAAMLEGWRAPQMP